MTQQDLTDKDGIQEMQISSVARECNEYGGNMSRGVKVGDKWFNVRGKTKEEINKLFNDEQLARGNLVKVKISNENTITEFIELVEKSSGHDGEMLSLNDLLDQATKSGMVSIKTQMISHDIEKASAVFKATVFMMEKQETKKGEPEKPPVIKEYQAHGDADQLNTGKEIGKHYIRMAESRAISRSLRWAVNASNTSKEELM